MEANQSVVLQAVKLITDTLEGYKIPQLEGAIAMLSILESLKKQGLDVRCEPASRS